MKTDQIIQNEELKKENREKKSPVTFLTVFTGVIIVFFIIQGIILMKHHSVEAYNIGIADVDNVTGTERGIVLRAEQVFSPEESGSAVFYATTGDWVSAGDYLMVTDPEGTLTETLRKKFYGLDLLSYKSRLKIQNTLKTAVQSYDGNDFSTIYSAKADIEEMILHSLISDGGEEVLSEISAMNLKLLSAGESGFFLNWTDGYEGKIPELLSSADFSEERYEARIYKSGDTVSAGEPVVKIAPDNKFTLSFLLSEEKARQFAGRKTLSVETGAGLQISGDFSITETVDHRKMGVLTFRKYGANFLSSRFVDFRILDTSVKGYKIPESAIIGKKFYSVPASFIMQSGNQKGVMLDRYGDGNAKFCPCTVYLQDKNPENSIVTSEGKAYVYSDIFEPGMEISEEGTSERTRLSVQVSVEGVYQINAGYCVFKPIVRLDNSLETAFVVVSASVRGGLKDYDRIIYDAAGFRENEIIFE